MSVVLARFEVHSGNQNDTGECERRCKAIA